MQISHLTISGFRGIHTGSITLGKFSVLIGPNNVGKTTIIEAISLLLGRDRLVRNLTEHDFFGSAPTRADRILIVATITGFRSNDPQHNTDWFRAGRGIPKWWHDATNTLKAQADSADDELACQIAFSARFDHDTLETEATRYFYDDSANIDPFDESAAITPLPNSLIKELGFFLVPANRTWDRMISFGSELFRRVVSYAGGKPAEAVLQERDRLRAPSSPLEDDPKVADLVAAVNADIEALLGKASKLKLRVTSTDSDGLLDAVIPHFAQDNCIPLPARRHGSGLISLQTLALLLRFGHLRVRNGDNFFMAIEEPELHVSPSQQRKLLHLMQSLATQTIVTSHSPAIAAVAAPHELILVSNDSGRLLARPLLKKPLETSSKNLQRNLFLSGREATVTAIMHPCLIVPEGKRDARWFRLFGRIADFAEMQNINERGNFTHEVGIIPTVDAQVVETFRLLQPAHPNVICLVDGDAQGKEYTKQLSKLSQPPAAIIRWPENWEIESIVTWIIAADPSVLSDAQLASASIPDTIEGFRVALSQRPLKDDEVAHDLIADVITTSAPCQKRVIHLLRTISDICRAPSVVSEAAECFDLSDSVAKLRVFNHDISGI